MGKIQVSQETYERLKEEFVLEDCGEIDVRGKGRMRTWFLVERKAAAAIALSMSMPGAPAALRRGSNDALLG